MTESTERDQNSTPEEDVEGHRYAPNPAHNDGDDDVEGHRLSAGTPNAMRNAGDDDDVEGHRIAP